MPCGVLSVDDRLVAVYGHLMCDDDGGQVHLGGQTAPWGVWGRVGKVVSAGAVEAGSVDLLRWAVVQLVVSKLFIYLPLPYHSLHQ